MIDFIQQLNKLQFNIKLHFRNNIVNIDVFTNEKVLEAKLLHFSAS